jgi:hypothetical protein
MFASKIVQLVGKIIFLYIPIARKMYFIKFVLCALDIKYLSKNEVVSLLIQHDVHRSAHHYINLKKLPTRCDRVLEFIIPVFLNCSTCFERHTAHYQELKNCNCSLWFYIPLRLPAADSCRQPNIYVEPEAAITVFELLMMSGVSLEICSAIKKYWNNKFYYTVAFCSLFLLDFS